MAAISVADCVSVVTASETDLITITCIYILSSSYLNTCFSTFLLLSPS